MIRASCLCGAVTMDLAQAPDRVTSCACSACRRLGTLWVYYPSDQVKISGPTVAYARRDLGEPPMLAFHHCPVCGCTTHWAALDPGRTRMGVNARLMAPEVVEAAELQPIDGPGPRPA